MLWERIKKAEPLRGESVPNRLLSSQTPITMKTKKILYWAATIGLSIAMLASAIMTLANPDHTIKEFMELGYPSYLPQYISIAKLFGVITLLYNQFKNLVEWAYAGFFFDFLLAFLAHYMVADNQHWMVLVPMGLLLISYFLKNSVRS